ncbi:hypothetical protein THAOC_20576 [Thalassiosira oceanica]|uniref:Uncharacterized protein n=1 Tax=Thalassiosira oceanica TaxID=159749 RepID=K0SE84_THAOC|nr:hypothetical protein THAOC_20576 [Thalassiosira oceanica]|eukprot:EJK59231.1 hypothetical protein THAOC_20576 [Thalassiosira oceanica]
MKPLTAAALLCGAVLFPGYALGRRLGETGNEAAVGLPTRQGMSANEFLAELDLAQDTISKSIGLMKNARDTFENSDGHIGEAISSLLDQASLLMEDTQGHLAISDRSGFDNELKEVQLASKHDYSDSFLDGVKNSMAVSVPLSKKLTKVFDDEEFFAHAEHLIDIIEQVKIMVSHTDRKNQDQDGTPSEGQDLELAILELDQTVQDYHKHAHHRRLKPKQRVQETAQPGDWELSEPFARPVKLIDHLRAANAARRTRGNRYRQLKEVDLGQCHPNCSVGDSTCQCKKLKKCAGVLSQYDLAVRFLGGFIDKDENSDDYGRLLVEQTSAINLFGADELEKKYNNIAELVSKDTNEENCSKLLSELYTACRNKNGCTEPNKFSAELSVNEICDSKNARTKVQMKSLGEVFDFQNWAVRATPAKLSNEKFDFDVDSGEVAYGEKKAVRCCRDTDEKDEWIKPVETGRSCPGSVLSQPWIGERPKFLQEKSEVDEGYTKYTAMKCLEKDNKQIKLGDPPREGQCLDSKTNRKTRYDSIDKDIKEGDPVPQCAQFCSEFELTFGYRGFHVKTRAAKGEEEARIGRCACLFDHEVTPTMPSNTKRVIPGDNELGGSGPVGLQDYNRHWVCYAFRGLKVDRASNDTEAVPSCKELCTKDNSCVSFDMHNKGDGNRLTERADLKIFVMKSLTVYGPDKAYDGRAAGCTYVEKDDAGDRTLQWGNKITSECQNADPRQVFLYDAAKKLVHVRSLGMKMCLDLRLDGVGNSNVYFSTCHGKRNQQWYHNEISPDTIKKEAIWVEDPHSGHTKCLGFASDGIIKADVKFCTDDGDIYFTEPLKTYRMKDGLGNCYYVQGDYTIARINNCDMKDNNVFLFDAKRKTVHVKSLGFYHCLDLKDAEGNVYFFKCHGRENQRWNLPSDLRSRQIDPAMKCLTFGGNKDVKARECSSLGYTNKIRLDERTEGTSPPVSSVECQTESTGLQDAGTTWYEKKSGANNEDSCQVLPFHGAVNFCKDKGGRLCTREELENGCTSMTGCGFDEENVWSSQEASPKYCNNDRGTDGAISYKVCNTFVDLFDDLYQYSDQENPMRKNKELTAHGSSGKFSNVHFPTDYYFGETEQGFAIMDRFDYGFKDKFIDSKDNRFCGAAVGPPSVLIQACDASQEFLLGKKVSVGLLKSVVDGIKEGKDKEIEEPYWLRWYKTLQHHTAIEYEEKWMNSYNETKMPNDLPDPAWLAKYLKVEDKNPYTSPSNVAGNPFYCTEKSTGRPIRSCEKEWLGQPSNPYKYEKALDQVLFSDSFSSVNSTCEKLLRESKFDLGRDFVCREKWLERESLSEVYAQWLSEHKSGNSSIDVYIKKCIMGFLRDCVESVLPARGTPQSDQYQCNRFWDGCRRQLELDEPDWEQKLRQLNESDCPHQTCQLEWLDDNSQVPASCERFKSYCQKKLDSDYPSHALGFCDDSKDKTCDVGWLNQTENPYSNDTDTACFNFWSFCYDQLKTNHTDHIYPITHFAGIKQTAEDLMPGSCCIDRPGQGFDDTHWGIHFKFGKDMKCRDNGKWHMGMSKESCEKGRGLWFRSPCYALYECVNGRPLPHEQGYRARIETWIVSSGVDLYDPTDPKQCETTRQALGYDKNHADDVEVCDTFKHHLCENDLFKEREESPAGEKLEDLTFKQVEYKPIEYPPDPPLYVDKLPDKSTAALIEANTYSDEEKTARSNIIASESQMQYEFSFLKIKLEKSFEGIERFIETVEAATETAIGSCENMEKAVSIAKTFCSALPEVLPGPCTVINNPAYLAWWGSYIAMTVTETDEVKQLRIKEVEVMGVTTDDTDTSDAYARIKAIDTNMRQHDIWVRDSIEILNKNMIEQHIQMRKELQARHQEMTNDINQSGDVDVGYLPFILDVDWEDDSIRGKQSQILEEVDELEEFEEEEKKRDSQIIDELQAIKEALKLLSPPTTGPPKQNNRGKGGKNKKSGKVEDDEENLFSRVVEDEEHEEPGQDRLLQNSLSEQMEMVHQKMEAQNEKADTKIEMIHRELEAQNVKIDAVDTKVDALSAKIGKLEDLMLRLLDAQQEQTQE